MKRFVSIFEYFYFSLYEWIRKNASNWEAGPELITSGLIYFCLLGNILFIVTELKSKNNFFILLAILASFILHIFLTYNYNKEQFERIEYNFKTLKKRYRKIIRFSMFLYVIASLYMFFYSATL